MVEQLTFLPVLAPRSNMSVPPDLSRRRAFALVLVMIALALITAVAVFFMANVGRERRGIDQYSRGSEVRQMADTAVNLVMGQINAATKEGTSTSAPVSWASQPGMIRTYLPNGGLSNAYKLYSWDNLVEAGAGFDPVNNTNEYPAGNWNTLPAQYTDLNAPVNGLYPIVDPGIANNAVTGTALVAGSAVPAWDFPGAFSVATTEKGYYPLATATGKLPMPVKWLYVLQDGTWTAPTPNGTNAVTVPAATTANPIVGRMAFWTDDETSKVNVNTASEGAFWDTPKAATQDEMQFAGNPPAKGEFQRVSGHPATTSLSAVFPEMRANGFSRWDTNGLASSIYLQEMQDLFSLTPRIDWGSSLSGTKQWGGSQAGTYPLAYAQTYAPPALTPKNEAVALDADRLYASADDVWFQPAGIHAGDARPANTAFANAAAALTAPQVAKRLFLFTANSRAPETTLFETPRISLWPVTWPYDKTTYYKSTAGGASVARTNPAPLYLVPDPANLAANRMTPQERLLAFCATLNQNATTPQPYYFQRQNPDSPTYDWNNITRNQNLVDYLSREMGQSFPGMGNGLSLRDGSKWGANNADWIALNCFDFSRSLVNQYTYGQSTNANSDYLYTYTGVQTASGLLNGTFGAHGEPNAYSVVPLHVPFHGNTYTTEGAFPALKEACLVFFATARNAPVPPTEVIDPKTGKPTPATDYRNPQNWKNLIAYNTGTASKNKSQTTKMQAVMLLSFSGMNPGVWSYRGRTYFNPVFWVKVSRASGAGSFLVNGGDIDFPTAASKGNAVQYSTNTYWSGGNYMSSMPASLMTHTGGVKTFDYAASPSNAYGNWSLVSKPIDVSGDDTTFTFTGSKIQVDIYACDQSGNLATDPTTKPELLVASQQIDFSAWDSAARGAPLPIPLAPRWNVFQAAAPTVKMPDLDNADYNVSDVNGWQTELVPHIAVLNDQTGAGKDDPRSPSYTIGTADAEPIVYAYCGTYSNDSSAGLKPGSTKFSNRVQGYRYSGVANSPVLKAEGSGAYVFQTYVQPHVFAQAYQLVTPYDTAISMVADPAVTTTSQTAGDPRLLGRGLNTSSGDSGATNFVAIDKALASVSSPATAPLHVVNYQGAYARSTDGAQHHTLASALGMRFPTGYWAPYRFGDVTSTASFTYNEIATRGAFTDTQNPYLLGRDKNDATVGVDTNVANAINSTWDWTTMPGNFPDGGYTARPDQDYQVLSPSGTVARVPYFADGGLVSSSSSGNQPLNVFMPNRQVPSPVILGTLPSDMKTGWQTLNFCPNPARSMNSPNANSHPGQGKAAAISAAGPVYVNLPDHLLLDLLWMPVAEPYPISDQLSTAGKVNLNYAMMPFPYIQRKTALDAVLKSVWLTALPSPSLAPAFAKYYKSYGMLHTNGNLDTVHTRFPVNVDATLKAFDHKFRQGDIFRSASQVCDVFLYPNNPAATNQFPGSSLVTDVPPLTSNIVNWWSSKSMTADNAREDPYSAIYSRVTTKSNTFTVHWKVQALQKRTGSAATTWTENQDAVTSELRGSSLIERYIDPNATNLPDYARPNAQNDLPLSHYYKWRTVSESYFQP